MLVAKVLKNVKWTTQHHRAPAPPYPPQTTLLGQLQHSELASHNKLPPTNQKKKGAWVTPFAQSNIIN